MFLKLLQAVEKKTKEELNRKRQEKTNRVYSKSIMSLSSRLRKIQSLHLAGPFQEPVNWKFLFYLVFCVGLFYWNTFSLWNEFSANIFSLFFSIGQYVCLALWLTIWLSIYLQLQTEMVEWQWNVMGAGSGLCPNQAFERNNKKNYSIWIFVVHCYNFSPKLRKFA